MVTVPWLIDVLREAGLPVVEQGDWRNRMVSGSFNPIGVLWHHTGSTSSAGDPAPTLETVINGRTTGDDPLPGPLCHALVDFNGVFHLISAGRANHAGEAAASGPIPPGSGNEMLIGWEIDYNGGPQAPTDAQYNNSVIGTAAVLKRLGRDASYARGHRETSVTGKVDPGLVDLDQMRADVAAAMTPRPAPPFKRTGASSGFSATWGVGRVDVFGRGDGAQAYHTYFERGMPGFPAWHTLAGSGGLRSRPAVVSWGTGRLDVFAIGPDQTMQHWWFDRAGENVWRGPEPLGNTTFAGTPSVVAWAPGRLDVFGRDTNNRLRHNYYQRGSAAWPGWETLDPDTTLGGDPTAVMWHVGRWDVFAVGAADQRMKHWWFDRLGDGRWRGAQTLGDTTFVGTPAAVAWDPGRLDLFGRDTNNRLRHNYFQDHVVDWPNWQTWAEGITSSPVAASWVVGRLDVFAIDGQRTMRHWWFDRLAGHRTRQGPQVVGNTTFTPNIDVITWEPGRLDVFGIDTNNDMRHNYFEHDGTRWPGWQQLNGNFP